MFLLFAMQPANNDMINHLYLIILIRVKMVKELTFTGIELHLQDAFRLHLKSCLKEPEGTISISLAASLGNCYGMVRNIITQKELEQANKVSVFFQKQLSILFESQSCGSITVLFSSSQSRISTFHTAFPLHPQDKALALRISNESSRPVFSINSKLSQIDKGAMPFIILKNITCELKNNITAADKFRYLDVVIGNRSYRNKSVNHVLYWQTPFKIYVEQEMTMNWNLVEEQTEQRINIPIGKVDSFTLLTGFQRVFIAKEFEMPKGCVQFYYETSGLRSKEEYERLAEIEQNNQKQILKLIVKTIKVKLKTPQKAISVRAFSGMNYLITEECKEESSEFLLKMNQYLYLDYKENKCNFIVYSNEEVLGYGVLLLNIIGFFERRVGIISPQTKKEIGYLMVSIQSQKHPSNSIQLANLKFNLGEQMFDKSLFFLSFRINGYYTRTQLKRVEQQIISFRRLILMKYTNEQDLDIVLTDSNNQEYCRAKIKLEMFKDCQNQSHCKKVLVLKPEVKCSLELMCIFGDLNKINLSNDEKLVKQIKKPEKQPELKHEIDEKATENKNITKFEQQNSLLKQKMKKETLVKEAKNHLDVQFKQFEQSLVNHIKGTQQSSLGLDFKRSITNKSKANQVSKPEKEQQYRVMYTSRPQKNLKPVHHYKSSQKELFVKQQLYRNTNKRLSQIYKFELPALKIKGALPVPSKKMLFSELKGEKYSKNRN